MSPVLTFILLAIMIVANAIVTYRLLDKSLKTQQKDIHDFITIAKYLTKVVESVYNSESTLEKDIYHKFDLLDSTVNSALNIFENQIMSQIKEKEKDNEQ